MVRILVLLACTVLLSCKQGAKQGSGDVAQTADLQPEIRLYTLDGGQVIVNQLELFASGDAYQGQDRTFANAYYVISHPKGNLMWDAGLPESLVGQEPYTSPDGAFTVSRKDSLDKQLAKIGMTTDDFRYVALSHTHFDHVGHLPEMNKATWLVQEEEYNWVTSDPMRKEYPDIFKTVSQMDKVELIKGDYDVFKDGTVVFKYMPGHTPGHQVLYLKLKEHGPLLLSGDLYHFSENREFKRIPIFNHDIKQTRESINAFEAFANEQNAKVYLQHEKEDFARMPQAPEYLK